MLEAFGNLTPDRTTLSTRVVAIPHPAPSSSSACWPSPAWKAHAMVVWSGLPRHHPFMHERAVHVEPVTNGWLGVMQRPSDHTASWSAARDHPGHFVQEALHGRQFVLDSPMTTASTDWAAAWARCPRWVYSSSGTTYRSCRHRCARVGGQVLRACAPGTLAVFLAIHLNERSGLANSDAHWRSCCAWPLHDTFTGAGCPMAVMTSSDHRCDICSPA